MKRLIKMALIAGGAALALASCRQQSGQDAFKYQIDEFADLRIIRYRIEGWEDLSLQQKEYVYHLSEAAKWGRDIYWDQNGKYNLEVRRVLENILENYDGDRDCEEFKEELKDRFGELPKPAENLLRVALLRSRAKEVFLTEIKGGNGKIKLSVKPDAPIQSERVPEFLLYFGGKMKYTRYGTPGFEYFYKESDIPEIDERTLLENAEMLVDRMKELY